MPTVELDTITPVRKAYLRIHRIKTSIIAQEGPGGGWPVIRYTGTSKDLQHMIIAFFEDWTLINYIKE